MARTVVIPEVKDNALEVDLRLARGPKFIVERETGRVAGMIVHIWNTNTWGTSDGFGGLTGFDHKSEEAAIKSLQKSKYKVVVDLTCLD